MSEADRREPIRFIMLGGFLGSGKTTALLRLARYFTDQGKRVGVITNDQADELVDTLAFREAGFTTEEIPSGCFCCHFEKLLEASGRLADGMEPDIILAEPVGSCTDLVNAVIAPLKKLYTDRFSVAPYVVLADPDRLMEALSGSGPAGFSRKVTYLYKMQQNEADVIALNKVDRLSEDEFEAVMGLLRRNFPNAAHLPVSALHGDGFEALVALLEAQGESGLHPADVDYEQYTEAEVALGWLNARVRLSADAPWDADSTLEAIGRGIQVALAGGHAEVAHFKMRLLDPLGGEAAIHSTSNSRGCEVRACLERTLQTADLVINLRAESKPEFLEDAVMESLGNVAGRHGLVHEVIQCDTFAPNPPIAPPASRMTVRI